MAESSPLPEEEALALDAALYDERPVERDTARAHLALRASPATLSALVALLDAPSRITRRRASRLLSSCRPERVRPHLLALLPPAPQQVGDRHRAAAARLLTLLSPQGEPALAPVLASDPSPRVRRAAATAATPPDALRAALWDGDAGVVEEALSALRERAEGVPEAGLLAALERHGAAVPGAARALGQCAPDRLWAAAAQGEAAALDALAIAAVAAPEPTFHDMPFQVAATLAAAHLRARPGDAATLAALAAAADPALRSVAARHAPPDWPGLADLCADADAGVAWLAQRARAGAYAPDAQAARLAPHARLRSPSARPPYGLTPDDARAASAGVSERAEAALALCHTRFDVNLGVAVRSAEAAGLSEVFTVGRGELLRSPARGTDEVIPVTHLPDAGALLRCARERGWQIVIVQQTPGSVPYHTAPYPPKPLFVMGAEDEGVPLALRAAADLAVEIPLFGVIDSLNVAAAATAVVFHWRCHASAP